MAPAPPPPQENKKKKKKKKLIKNIKLKKNFKIN
jgi:hypothetical protein